jgi:F0F1-type ATP synthase assembly protein I
VSRSALSRAMGAAAVVSAVPGYALGAAWVGRLLDDVLGTTPWCTVGMLILGFALGIAQLFRGLRRLTTSDHADPPDPPP